MAFPTVTGTPTTTTNSSSTSLALTMPSPIVAGQLLLTLSADSVADTATTAMTGWTKIGGLNNSGSLTVFGKIAVGSDTGTVTGTSSARAVIVYQIDGWTGSLADIQIATAAPGTVDPPSLTPGFGALDYLWVVGARNRTVPTVAPTNYTDLITAIGNATLAIGSAQRALNAASEDPGAFTVSIPTGVVTATIAIPPIPALGSPPNLLSTPPGPRMRSFNW